MQLMIHAHLGNITRTISEGYRAIALAEARKLVDGYFDGDC